MQSINGIFYSPSGSSQNTSSNQTYGIIRRPFVYDHRLSSQRSDSFRANFLTVDLNEYSTITSNDVTTPEDLNGAYSAIIVHAYIFHAQLGGTSSTEDFYYYSKPKTTFFTLKFVTDYNYSTQVYAPQSGFNNSTQTYIWSWEDQTVSTAASVEWVPAGNMASWLNGDDAVDGTYWDSNEETIQGWRCGTPSYSVSSGTNPGGGVDTNASNGPNPNFKYAYTEGSSPYTDDCYVMRTGPTNVGGAGYTTLKFFTHGVGTNLGTLSVYASTSTTANSSTADLLTTIGPAGSGADIIFTQTNTFNPYQEVTVDISGFTDTIYIYFVYRGATGFRSDVAIDQVTVGYFEGGLNYEFDAISYPAYPTLFSEINPSGLSISYNPFVTVENKGSETDFANPQVTFGIEMEHNQNTAQSIGIIPTPYIKGSYLLL